MTECFNCSLLNERIRYLESENRRLQRKIRELQRVIERLEKLFRRLLDLCRDIMSKMTDEYLSKKSGVERGKWAWARGMHMCAKAIAQVAAKGWWLAKLHLN